MARALLVGAVLVGCAVPAGCGSGSVAGPGSGDAGSFELRTADAGRATPDPAVCAGIAPDQLSFPPDAVHLVGGTVVEAGFVCDVERRRVPGDGEWTYLVVSRVTAGLEELLTVYAQPDARRGAEPCTLEGRPPLVVWLQTDGSQEDGPYQDGVVPVRAPRGVCGHPIAAAGPVYQALKLEQVRETKLQQVRSQVALDSLCHDAWKVVETRPDPRRFTRDRSARHPGKVEAGTRVCGYVVAAEDQVPGDLIGTEHLIGTLRTGTKLTRAEAARLNDALAEAPVDQECAAADWPRDFLLVDGPRVGVALTADGCVMQVDGAWRVDPDVYSAVRSALPRDRR